MHSVTLKVAVNAAQEHVLQAKLLLLLQQQHVLLLGCNEGLRQILMPER